MTRVFSKGPFKKYVNGSPLNKLGIIHGYWVATDRDTQEICYYAFAYDTQTPPQIRIWKENEALRQLFNNESSN